MARNRRRWKAITSVHNRSTERRSRTSTHRTKLQAERAAAFRSAALIRSIRRIVGLLNCNPENPTLKRSFTVQSLLSLAALIAAAAPASAHPLGNFTINHLVKIDVDARTLSARYVLDMAEIPTFQVMRARNPQGRLDSAQLQSWARDEVAQIQPTLDVQVDGRRLALEAAMPKVATRPGAGGLPTLYWVEEFRAALPQGAA